MKYLCLFALFLGTSALSQTAEHFLVINPKGHKSLIYDMDIDPDGQIVTGSFDKNTIVWNAKNGKIAKEFKGQIGPGAEGMVYSIDVSPNGKWLAVAGWMGEDDESENLGDIRIYNYQTGKMRKRLKWHEDAVRTVQFTPDSKYLISADASGVIVKWEATRFIAETYYTQVNDDVNQLAVAQDYFISTHEDGMVYKWAYDKFKPVKKLNFYEKLKDLVVSTEAITSNSGEKVAVAGKILGMVIVLNEKLSLQQHFFTGDNSIIQMAFAPSENRLAISVDQNGKHLVKIFDLLGKEWKEVKYHKFDDIITCLEFTDENTLVCAGGRDNNVYIFSIEGEDFKQEMIMSGEGRNYYSANLVDRELAFTNEPTKAYGRSEYTDVFDMFDRKMKTSDVDISKFSYPEREVGDWKIWEYTYLRLTDWDPQQILLIEHNGFINDSIQFFPWDGYQFYTYALLESDLIAVGGSYGILQIHDRKGRLLTRCVGHEGGLRSVSLSGDGKFLISSGVDQTVRFWSMEDIKGYNPDTKNAHVVYPVASMFISQTNEWVLWNQDGYFTSSKKGAKYVGYHVNHGKSHEAKFYPFDQFDLKFNRPDILMEDLDLADQGIIELYRMAYLKRLKRMGIDEEDLSGDIHTPEITSLNTSPSDGSVTLNIKAEDKKYALSRLNVFVNDVPIYGRNGLKINGDVQEFTEEIEVQLMSGNNKIEVSVLNAVGVESLRETVYLDNENRIKPNLYVVALGVSGYADASFNLNYAAKDAKDFAGAFDLQEVYETVHSKVLTNEEVTRDNVFELKSFFEKANTNDVVMMFIAGHGVLDVNLDYYFCTHDMDFQDPAKSGVSYAELEEMFDGIKAIRKLLIMDTCHSGELFKDEVEEVALEEDEGEEDVTFRTTESTTTLRTRQGLKKTNEAVKEMFNDLNRGTGTTVISSAGGVEYAMESDEWKNGLFTYCLLDGLKDNKADLNKDNMIFLSELQQYIGKRVYQLSNGKQQPTSRFENLSLDYRIW